MLRQYASGPLGPAMRGGNADQNQVARIHQYTM
jgi:hypothetical protein